jgi:hypothetical protein
MFIDEFIADLKTFFTNLIGQNDFGKLTMGIVTVKTQESNRVIKS